MGARNEVVFEVDLGEGGGGLGGVLGEFVYRGLGSGDRGDMDVP